MSARQSTSSRQTFETPLEPQCETVDAICAEHGAYVARVLSLGMGSPIKSHCPQCVAIRQAAEEANKRRSDEFQRAREVAELSHGSGIPKRFADRDFTGYVARLPGQKIALGVCRAFAETWPEKLKTGASLVLVGGPGTGKTHLACAVGLAVIQQHLGSVAFGTVATMLRHIKDTYRKDSTKNEQDAINDLTRPALLILDEVGVQVGSEHEKLLMFEVLNSRYQECRPTILISNLAADELEQFLGQRVMDRYRECGSVIGFDWQSHRGAA